MKSLFISLFLPNCDIEITLAPCPPALRRAALGKIVHLLAVRPAKRCNSDSPLHPLFVCNGEADCVDGRDELNCTQGVNACSIMALHGWMRGGMEALKPLIHAAVFSFCPTRNNLLCNPVPVQQRLLHPEEERQV